MNVSSISNTKNDNDDTAGTIFLASSVLILGVGSYLLHNKKGRVGNKRNTEENIGSEVEYYYTEDKTTTEEQNRRSKIDSVEP